MEYYMDEKWKVSKDEKGSGKSSSSSSHKSSSSKSSYNNNLLRSCSTRSASTSKASSSSSSLPRSSSQRCSEFTRKCSSMAKEQKAKFYIVKRCISMLVSWKKNGGSDS